MFAEYLLTWWRVFDYLVSTRPVFRGWRRRGGPQFAVRSSDGHRVEWPSRRMLPHDPLSVDGRSPWHQSVRKADRSPPVLLGGPLTLAETWCPLYVDAHAGRARHSSFPRGSEGYSEKVPPRGSPGWPPRGRVRVVALSGWSEPFAAHVSPCPSLCPSPCPRLCLCETAGQSAFCIFFTCKEWVSMAYWKREGVVYAAGKMDGVVGHIWPNRYSTRNLLKVI